MNVTIFIPVASVAAAAGLVYYFAKPATPTFALLSTCFGYFLGITALVLLLVDLKVKNDGYEIQLITWWRVLYWS